MDVLIGVLPGVALSASLFAATRLLPAPRVLSPAEEAVRALLHAATAALDRAPRRRRGGGARGAPTSPCRR
jgi:hypothetical protein